MTQTPVPIRIQTKADVMNMLLNTMSAIHETLSKKHTVDPTMAPIEIEFLKVTIETAKVYLDHCDMALIEPDEFEKQLQKLISNLYSVSNCGNNKQIELEILTINKILEIYRQCKKGAVSA